MKTFVVTDADGQERIWSGELPLVPEGLKFTIPQERPRVAKLVWVQLGQGSATQFIYTEERS